MKKILLEFFARFLKLIIIKLGKLEKKLNPGQNELCSKDGKIRVRALKWDRAENICDFLVSSPIYRSGAPDYRFVYPSVIPIDNVGSVPSGVIKILDLINESKTSVWVKFYPHKIKVQKNGLLEWEEVIPQINRLIISYFEERNKTMKLRLHSCC